jgi:acetyl esterase/lipase
MVSPTTVNSMVSHAGIDAISGGGFSMGSAYFYLEYLLTWLSVLSSSGYRNPAIFALEYTLVPDASFPVQVDEAMKAYEHVLTVAVDPSTVCVSGDSAGATLVLCLLLRLGADNVNGRSAIADRRQHQPARPGLAVLISPWVTLLSERHRNTVSDYLDVQKLHQYGELFAGRRISSSDPSVSPGCCEDTAWWKRSSPSRGIFIHYGTDEVLKSDIEKFVGGLQKAGILIEAKAEPGGIHAWPVASLFLCSSRHDRLEGLVTMTREISQRMPSA